MVQIEKVVSLIHCADNVLEMSHPNECLLNILGVSIGVVFPQSLECGIWDLPDFIDENSK